MRGSEFYNVSSDNERKAALLIENFCNLDKELGFEEKLCQDMMARVKIYRWAQPFIYEEKNRQRICNDGFSKDIDALRELYISISSGEISYIGDKELYAHRLAAQLKEEGQIIHEEEGTLTGEWSPSAKELGELGFYDAVVHRALQHMVLDDYGIPRWAAIMSMGQIGQPDFLPTLKLAYDGKFRNLNTPGRSNSKYAAKAIQLIAKKGSNEAIKFLAEHIQDIEKLFRDVPSDKEALTFLKNIARD